MITKHNNKILDNLLPEEPFIVAFGSSHTYGSCKMDGQEEIDRHDIWVSIVGERLGLPVVNLGTPGVTNNILLQQIIDFTTLSRSRNCVLAFIEARVADRVFELSNDISTNITHLGGGKQSPTYSELASARDFRKSIHPDQGQNQTLMQKFVTRIPVLLSKDNKKPIESMLQAKMYADDVVPPNILYGIETYRDLLLEYFFGYALEHITDFNSIKAMTQILELANIKSKWFCFDNFFTGHIHEREYRFLMEKYSETSTVFDKIVKNLEIGVYGNYIKETGEQAPSCDCGHYTKEVHSWIADKIYEEVKDILK